MRNLIGARAERIAYLNCVMERSSLDALAIAQREGKPRPQI